LFPLLPLVAIAELFTGGMVLFLFLVFLVGLANTSSLFVLRIPTFAPANNGGLLSFSPSESSPSSSCSPSLRDRKKLNSRVKVGRSEILAKLSYVKFVTFI
jgi:hypothetical protein